MAAAPSSAARMVACGAGPRFAAHPEAFGSLPWCVSGTTRWTSCSAASKALGVTVNALQSRVKARAPDMRDFYLSGTEERAQIRDAKAATLPLHDSAWRAHERAHHLSIITEDFLWDYVRTVFVVNADRTPAPVVAAVRAIRGGATALRPDPEARRELPSAERVAVLQQMAELRGPLRMSLSPSPSPPSVAVGVSNASQLRVAIARIDAMMGDLEALRALVVDALGDPAAATPVVSSVPSLPPLPLIMPSAVPSVAVPVVVHQVAVRRKHALPPEPSADSKRTRSADAC